MEYKHGDTVVVYKFFQGVFSREFGEKRINPYGEHGKFLGIIDIVGERRRSIQCSTKPGVIRNNFIWYPVEEENSRLKALKIFKARENILLHKAEMEIETRIEHERYLNDCLNGPVYIDNKGMFHTPNEEDKDGNNTK